MAIRKLFLREKTGQPNRGGGFVSFPWGQICSWGLWNDICLGNPALLLCLRPLSFPPTPPSDLSRRRRKMGRQKEEGVTGEERRFHVGNEGLEVTVPGWRQAGLLPQCPSLPAEPSHLMTVPTSHQTEQDPPRQMLAVRGQEGTEGALPILWPQHASHRLLASLRGGSGASELPRRPPPGGLPERPAEYLLCCSPQPK